MKELTMPDYSWAERDDWPAAWAPAVDAIGELFGDPSPVHSVDEVEAGAVRRFLEPLEFDCPLHYDVHVAKAQGYPAIVAPYSGLATWTSAGQWMPGDPPVYVTAARNHQPPTRGAAFQRPGPDCNGGFVTDVEYEYHAPFLVGHRYSVLGRRLLAVTTKETSVGRGAFLTWESIVTDAGSGERVARQSSVSYYYVATAKK